jgi:hypothetical protein
VPGSREAEARRLGKPRKRVERAAGTGPTKEIADNAVDDGRKDLVLEDGDQGALTGLNPGWSHIADSAQG